MTPAKESRIRLVGSAYATLQHRVGVIAGAHSHLWCLFALPFLILLINRNWIYSPAGTIDPWLYYGFFTHLHEFKVNLFPDTYYGSRLSYVLPGYLVNLIFRPVVANYILHITLYFVAIVSLYDTLRTTHGRRTALIASILCGSYQCFLYAIGWDYVDGAGNAYYLLTVSLLTRATVQLRKSGLFLGAAGAAYAGLLYCNIFWIIFFPFFFLFTLYVGRDGKRWWQFAFRNISWFGLGATCTTCVFSAVNYLIEGKLWFYRPAINFVAYYAGLPNPWKLYGYAWLNHAGWVLFPAATFVGSIVFVILNRRPERPIPYTKMFALNYIGSFALAALFELRGQPIFEYDFKTSHLTAAMFLAVGALFCGGAEAFRRRDFAVFLGSAFTGMMLPLFGLHRFTQESTLSYILVCGFAVGSLGMIVKSFWRKRGASLIAFAIAFAAMHSASSVGSGWLGLKEQSRGADFDRVVQGMNVIDGLRAGRNVRFWYNEKDPNGNIFTAVNSIYLWGYTWISRRFPSLTDTSTGGPRSATSGDFIVVLSSNAAALDQASEALRRVWLDAILIAHTYVGEGESRYYVTLIRADALPDPSNIPTTACFAETSPEGSLCAPKPGVARVTLPPDRWTRAQIADPNAWVHVLEDGVHVSTPMDKWGYTTFYAPLHASETGQYIFELRYRLLSGQIAFGALSSLQEQWIGQAVPSAGDEGEVARFTVNLAAGQKFWLLTTNNNPKAMSSKFIITSLRAFRVTKETTPTKP